ncbi:MAG TPA: rhomboid family intramembrane serine protease [Chitinophagaceae bacterium]|nr:rhomboid family intramembrane serine protease [Chitinophagaceae bacterium]
MSGFYTRPDNFPPIVKNLIIINILVYAAQVILDSQYQITARLIMYPLVPEELYQIAVRYEVIGAEQKFKPYQVFTHMFSHAPPPMIFHILFNMFALWMFGRVLENVWGSKRFLFFYMVCGLGAALAHLGMQYLRADQLLQEIQSTGVLKQGQLEGALAGALGASGAIMGIFAAFAYLFPNTHLYIMLIPFPIKAKWAVLGLIAIDLFGGFSNSPGDNIAHFAHLGGAITGFIVVLIWNKTRRRTLY